MAKMPREPEAFAEQVAYMLRRLQPDRKIDLVGPRELVVDGRRLDLENLFRLVNHDRERGVEIVENFLEKLFEGDAIGLGAVTFDFAEPRIMPRIQPVSIFDGSRLSPEHVAHVPYVNGTVIVFVIDLPEMTVSVSTEQTVRWGVDADDLEDIARKNLDKYQPDLEVQIVESKEGGRAALLTERDGYDAARLLLSGLHGRLAPELGGDFLVATPARDMFIAFTHGPGPFVDRLKDRIHTDYRRLPYPITERFFYVTRDGVAGTDLAESDAEAA